MGASPSCGVLVVTNADGTASVFTDPNVGPYDGNEDTLVGIRNSGTTPVDKITVTGPGTGLAAFEGDGLCSFGVTGCPFGPTGYEGPGTSIVVDPALGFDTAEIDFTPPLAPGGTAYLSLENQLTAASLTVRTGGLGGGDRDGDGLPDSLESGRLASLGANPDHKDIFVEVHASQGAMPTDGALDLVTKSFSQAPVTNPDGTTGINLHFIKSDQTLTDADVASLSPGGVPDFAAFGQRFGSDANHDAFHYLVSTAVTGPSAVLGSADGIPGQYLYLNVCGTAQVSYHERDDHDSTSASPASSSNSSTSSVAPSSSYPEDDEHIVIAPRSICGASDAVQASMLMHELGHDLGLHHGGTGAGRPDLEDRFKPNYFSVMNVGFALTGGLQIDTNGVRTTTLDFSRWSKADVNTLNENALSEQDGIKSTNPANPLPAGLVSFRFCGAKRIPIATRVGVPVDWNCDRAIKPAPVAADIDRFLAGNAFEPEKPRTALDGNDDWGDLVYKGGAIGGGTGTAPDPVQGEPTAAQRDAFVKYVEASPGVPSVEVERHDARVTIQVEASPRTASVVQCFALDATGTVLASLGSTSLPAPSSAPHTDADFERTVTFTVPSSAVGAAAGVACSVMTTNFYVLGSAAVPSVST